MPGGVCAVLDYEVELMAEYIAEMTTRLAVGTGAAPAPFRKFISQILSSTRLPSTTILLGMNYLAKRVNTINMNVPPTKMSEGQIWRMLTVALLLGSKFLDDNTFQNRSWAEVSGIPVRELNTLEQEWMGAINWNLFVNLDRSEDYNAWLKSWRDWLDNKKHQQAVASRERLASLVSPIETDVSRSRSSHAHSAWHQQQVAEFQRYERLSSMKRAEQAQQQGYRQGDSSWPPYEQHLVSCVASPLTPPDSGYGSPDYLDSATSANAHYNDWFSQQNRAIMNSTYGRHQQQQQQHHHHQYQRTGQSTYPSNHQSNFGYHPYGQDIWNHSPGNCRCAGCFSMSPQHHKPPYFGLPSYGQTVAS